VERIEVAFVPDPVTAVQLLEEGLIDAAAPTLGVQWEDRLEDAEGVETDSRLGPDALHILVNAEEIPSPETRRRLAEAVDRGRFADVVVRETGRRLNGILVPEQEGAVPAWEGIGEEDAPELSLDREIELVFIRAELPELLARFLQSELEEAGGDVELVGVDADVFHETFLPERRFDLAIWQSRSGPAPRLARWFGPGGLTGLEDGALADLLEEAAGVGEEASAALAQAQRRLARLAPVLPLVQSRVAVGWRRGVEGIRANPAEGPLWNALAWSKPAP
jgi:ABC-type transport system substrate-binding protein